jgi:ribosome-binding protein aMBF1 (putative translation factor)
MLMSDDSLQRPMAYQTVELEGVRYVILREALFRRLCEHANVKQRPDLMENQPRLEFDRSALAERLKHRRRAAGLSQVELARRAGIRAETLNRIERGRTEPDFATVRKLVEAMNAFEQEQAQHQLQRQENQDDKQR